MFINVKLSDISITYARNPVWLLVVMAFQKFSYLMAWVYLWKAVLMESLLKKIDSTKQNTNTTYYYFPQNKDGFSPNDI